MKNGRPAHYPSMVIANRFGLTERQRKFLRVSGRWSHIVLMTDNAAIRLLLGVSK